MSNIPSRRRASARGTRSGGCCRRASTSNAAARERRNVLQRSHSGRKASTASISMKRGERLVQPDAVPPLHRHEVAEPHVGELVGDHVGDRSQLGLGGAVGVDQQRGLAVGDAAEVLHRARREVGERDHVELVARVRDAVVVGEEAQARTRRPPARTPSGGPCRARYDDPQRRAVDVDRLGGLERADDERDQVGRHLHRVGEPDRPLAVAGRLSRDLAAVRDRERARRRTTSVTREDRLELGLVPARERPPGVGGLELGGGDRVRGARVVRVGGAVEPLRAGR